MRLVWSWERNGINYNNKNEFLRDSEASHLATFTCHVYKSVQRITNRRWLTMRKKKRIFITTL